VLKEAWAIPTKKLKKLLTENNFELKENAGDENSNTKGYVIPKNKYITHFKVMTINIPWENH
jgi:HKD family nuclease